MSTNSREFWNYQSGKIQNFSEKSFWFPEKIDSNQVISEYFTGMIESYTGMINDNTGLIGNSTGLIEEDTGMITETNDTEHVTSGRRRRSKERGKDSKP